MSDGTDDRPGFSVHDTRLAERVEEMNSGPSAPVPWVQRDDRRHHNPRQLR